MVELKPCPFCGGEAVLFRIPENTKEEMEQHPNWYWRYSGSCVIGCRTNMCVANFNRSIIYFSQEMAVEAWNRRINLSEPPEKE
jgi:hypothetical protein